MGNEMRKDWWTWGALALGAATVAGYGLRRYLGDAQNYLRVYQGATFVQRECWPSHARVRLYNGRIADVAHGRYLSPDVEIVLHEGRIAAMPGLRGEPASVPVDFSVNLRGRAVVPGLFNAHCHVQMINPALPASLQEMPGALLRRNLFRDWQLAHTMAECLTRGITTVRDALTEDLGQLYHLRDAICLGKMPGPRLEQSILVSPVGGSFAPQDRGLMDRLMWRTITLPQIPYDKECSGMVLFAADAGPQEVRDAVDRAIDERGAQSIKIYDQRTRRLTADRPAVFMTLEQLEALVDRARARGVPTQMHHIAAESLRRAAQVGVVSLDHLPGDRLLTDEEVQMLLAAETVLIPTLSIIYTSVFPIQGHEMANHPAMQRLSAYRQRTGGSLDREYWIPQLREEAAATYTAPEPRQPNPFMRAMSKGMAALLTVWVENLRRLHTAGVPIGCGNDAGATPSTPAMVREELGMLGFGLNDASAKVQFGGADALRAATLHSARALGVEEQRGSIEPGKVADLVLLDGDPLQDASLIGSRAAAVWREGQLVVDNSGLCPQPA